MDIEQDIFEKIKEVNQLRLRKGDILVFHIYVGDMSNSDSEQFIQQTVRCLKSNFELKEIEIFILPFRDTINKLEIIRKEEITDGNGSR